MRVWMQIDSGPHEGRNTEGAHFTHGCIPATVAVLWSFHLYRLRQKKSRKSTICGKNHGISNQSRTGVDGMRTRCPRPLDDGDTNKTMLYFTPLFAFCKLTGRFCQFPFNERAVSAIFFAASSGVIVPANRF